MVQTEADTRPCRIPTIFLRQTKGAKVFYKAGYKTACLEVPEPRTRSTLPSIQHQEESSEILIRNEAHGLRNSTCRASRCLLRTHSISCPVSGTKPLRYNLLFFSATKTYIPPLQYFEILKKVHINACFSFYV